MEDTKRSKTLEGSSSITVNERLKPGLPEPTTDIRIERAEMSLRRIASRKSA